MAKQGKDKDKGLTVKKEEDMAEWYSQVCLKSEVADFAPVKGCYIIRPLGYGIWQSIQDFFNARLKHHKVQNAYFPLFIPESFFHKEAQHAEGFSPEVAWISNKDEDQERLAIRPTSETIMYDSYSRWVRSWRDLPLRINQWANVVRWETEATKLFLRSREFLWQEGHCVYETEEECDVEVELFLKEYVKLCEELLALPVLPGKKTDKEKFAGAKYTLTIESFMPDGKALQCGTSHNLGQGFGKAFGISYIGKDEQEHTPWQNSWGISTRLIGATIMMHSDNKGLVLPPRVAPNKIVIVPILFEDTKDKVLAKVDELKKTLAEFDPIVDDREGYSPGWKFNEWELKGIPLRIEIGPKDLETNQVVLARRDKPEKKDKMFIEVNDIKETVAEQLDLMHNDLLQKARQHITNNIVEVADWETFMKEAEKRKLIKTTFCGNSDCEELIKDKTNGVTSRCVPLDDATAPKGSKCVHCGNEAKVNIYFSKSY